MSRLDQRDIWPRKCLITHERPQDATRSIANCSSCHSPPRMSQGQRRGTHSEATETDPNLSTTIRHSSAHIAMSQTCLLHCRIPTCCRGPLIIRHRFDCWLRSMTCAPPVLIRVFSCWHLWHDWHISSSMCSSALSRGRCTRTDSYHPG